MLLRRYLCTVLLETGCPQAVSFLASFRVENPFFWRDLPITILEALSNFGFHPQPGLFARASLLRLLVNHFLTVLVVTPNLLATACWVQPASIRPMASAQTLTMAWLTLEDEKLDWYLLSDPSLVPVELTIMGIKELGIRAIVLIT